MSLTQDKIAEVLTEVLIETRDGRLGLEIATWLHDLDKASWPFLLYGAIHNSITSIALSQIIVVASHSEVKIGKNIAG